MKRLLCSAISLVFFASLFGIVGLAQPRPKFKKVTAKLEKGAKVAERVRALKASDNSIRAALEAFEKKGHSPKIDEAVSISGRIEDSPVSIPFRRTHHAQTVTGDGVVITFVTVVDLFNEWQGTVIAQFYDDTGAFIEQYVADVVLTRSEYDPSDWTGRYDLKFEADGLGYIVHRPGMFTNFILGTPILQQPTPPLSLDASRFLSVDQMNAFYALYPEQVLYDVPPTNDGGGGTIIPILTRFARPQLFGPAPRASEVITVRVVGWNAFAREVGIRGSGIGMTCGVGALLGAIGYGGCAAAGMAGVVTVAALNHLRVIPR